MSRNNIALLIINDLISKNIKFTVNYSETTGHRVLGIDNSLYVYFEQENICTQCIYNFSWDKTIPYQIEGV